MLWVGRVGLAHVPFCCRQSQIASAWCFCLPPSARDGSINTKQRAPERGERGEATRRRGVTCSVDHPLEKQLWSETYFARGTEGLGRNREASGGRGAGVVHAESEIDAMDALAESKAVRTAVATRKSPC